VKSGSFENALGLNEGEIFSIKFKIINYSFFFRLYLNIFSHRIYVPKLLACSFRKKWL